MGSVGSTANSSRATTRVTISAPASLHASPTATGVSPCRTIIRTTLARGAPSAIRTPISVVRWFTESETTSAMPEAVMISATAANSVTSIAVRRGGASDVLLIDSSVRIWLTGWRGSTAWTAAGMRRAKDPGSAAVRTSNAAPRKPVCANDQ